MIHYIAYSVNERAYGLTLDQKVRVIQMLQANRRRSEGGKNCALPSLIKNEIAQAYCAVVLAIKTSKHRFDTIALEYKLKTQNSGLYQDILIVRLICTKF